MALTLNKNNTWKKVVRVGNCPLKTILKLDGVIDIIRKLWL